MILKFSLLNTSEFLGTTVTPTFEIEYLTSMFLRYDFQKGLEANRMLMVGSGSTD